MSNGLIDRAFLSGSHDPALYYRKYPRILWKEKGGYEIQATPQEIAAAISQSRAWVKGSRMLAVGSETLGAERFIAENLGMLDVEYIGSALPYNLENKPKKVDKPTGKYDVITVYGTAKVEALLPFTKIGTLIIFIGVGPLAKNPELRQSWLNIRKKHMTMLQTGGENWQTGVGVVKILFVEGQDVKSESVEMDSTENDSQRKEADSQGDEKPEGNGNDLSEVVGVSETVQNPDSVNPVKRKPGRQPGSKNKVKA